MKSIKVSERDFSKQLEDALDIFKWRWVHFRPARVSRGGKDTYETAYTGYKGFPDYVCVRGDRIVFIEIKGTTGKVSPEQEEWLQDLTVTDAEVYLLYPDYDISVILS